MQWDASAKQLIFSAGASMASSGEIAIGQRTFPATDVGLDLTTNFSGIRVCTEMLSTGTGILYNTTDYVGTAVLAQLTLNKAVTLGVGGGYGWAAGWFCLELEKGIDATGGGSAVWALLECDNAITITTSAGPPTTYNALHASVTLSHATTVVSGSAKVYGLWIDNSINSAANFTAGILNALQIDKSGTSKNWQIGINIPSGACDLIAQVGTLTQNTDGTGQSIKDATHYAGELNPASIIRIFADTDSAAISGDNATFWIRNLIGTTQTISATWSGIRSHIYIPTAKNLEAGFWNCVRGYIEMAGATTLSDATICLSGIEGYFGLTGTVAIGASAVITGVKSIIANEGAGAFTGDGKAVAFYIAPGTPHWSHGIYMPPNTVHRGIWVGEEANTVGSGVPCDYTNWGLGTAAGAQGNAIYADDGGVTWAGDGYIEGMTVRMLTTSAVTSEKDVSVTALHPDLFLNANYDGKGGLSAIWASTTVNAKSMTTDSGWGNVGAGHFSVTLSSGYTLAANSWVAPLSVSFTSYAGTRTGKIVGLLIRKSMGDVGVYDGAFGFINGDGVCQAAAVGAVQDLHLRVVVMSQSDRSGTVYTIPMYRA